MAHLYRKRSLSPVEVIDAFLARIEKLNPTLNAFVTLTEETARMAARSAEQRLGASDDLPLLFGIPFSVKDTLPTAGVRTTFGSRLFADFVPDEDAAAVAAVKRVGGILIGKTNSPTLGWIGVTHNKIFGATPNPSGSFGRRRRFQRWRCRGGSRADDARQHRNGRWRIVAHPGVVHGNSGI